VTGDYRLLPESTGTDLNEDVADFWDWMRADLQPYLNNVRPGVEADLGKILVHGESAGGTLSLLSALSQPPGFIKAIIATYPVTTIAPKRTKPPYGAPLVPESVLQEHLSSIQPGKIVTAAIPPDRFKLVLSILQQDLLSSYYGSDEKYEVWKLLEKADSIPQTFIVHGDDDLAVPVHGTLEWVAAAKEKFGEEKIQLHIEPGAGHGFDAVSATLETPWLQDGLKEITAKWFA
jgi:acetyl esterase/lipase